MAETLSPVPKLSFLDNNGKPLVGGRLFTYAAGTSTKLATYTDSSGGTPNSNPIVLNFRGEANVWIPANVPYKYVLAPANDTDPPGSPIWTVDNLVNSQLLTLYGGVDTGSVNAYILTFVANFTSYTDGIVVYWIPSHTNTGPSTININGIGPVAITQQDGSPLAAGQIQANTYTQIIYRGTGFVLLGDSGLSGSFTATVTGTSGPATDTMYYQIAGSVVTLYAKFSIVGASSSDSMTVTGLPAAVRPNYSFTSAVHLVRDNSLNLPAVATIGSGSSTITFSRVTSFTVAPVANGFTNSGVVTKGIPAGWLISYAIG